ERVSGREHRTDRRPHCHTRQEPCLAQSHGRGGCRYCAKQLPHDEIDGGLARPDLDLARRVLLKGSAHSGTALFSSRSRLMRIAQIAPLAESVPPRFYGGTERVVSWLTEELVQRGHKVTLFASGDSKTSGKL